MPPRFSLPTTSEAMVNPLYQRVLGEQCDRLHPALCRFFADDRPRRAVGRLRVTRTAGWLRKLAATALGLPPAGEYDLVLEVTPHAAGERWVRRFGKHVLATNQREHHGFLRESSGPAD